MSKEYPSYNVYKGLQKPLIFKGFKGKFIYIGGACIISALLLCAIVSTLASFMWGGITLVIVMFGGLGITSQLQRKGLHRKDKRKGIYIVSRTFIRDRKKIKLMKKKSEFEAPYIGIETIDNTPIFYNRRGDYSVIIKCENPIIQYSADMDAYYDFHHLFTNILKVLGTGYTIQKQDILCKKSFLPPQNRKNDYLSNRYFEHFKGRIYTDISTYLVITGEVERSKFFSFDPRRFDTFIRNITKVLGLFANRGIRAKLLNENEIEIYIKRFLSINFNQQTVSLKNIKAREENLIIGEKNVQCISLVDIDEVNFPSVIKPYKEVNIGLRFPVDLLSFLHDTPSIDTIIYNQVINIPDQRNEANKLEGKKKKHKGMPDPANDLCVEDIERVQSDIAREGQMLVYAHYNIILAGLDDISKAINYVETSLFDCGIIINKQCFNQLELFECALPGNAINLNSYDKFLTTSDAAICLLFKEKLQVTENSPFLTYFTDRQGLPVGIDMSGKEGEKKIYK